jgi:hypothetical protein
LRQIGGSENIKLAFDFLDDVDARFCIRSITPYATPNDTIIECFTVDNGNVSYTGYTTSGNNVWNRSREGIYRTYYATNEISYYCCGGNSAEGHIFMNSGYSHVFKIKNNGDVSCTGALTTTGNIICNGQLAIGNSTPFSYKLYVLGVSYLDGNFKCAGIANIHNNSPYAVVNNFMAAGSLTIGGTTADYGTATNWSSSTAGLMMECNNYTEICIHDSGSRIASPMYYDGINNIINIGRDKGWGTSSTNCSGNFSCLLYSVDYVGYDDVGVLDVSGTGQNNIKILRQIWNSFTAFHRCFIDDELFNIDNPQDFKDIYMGRIVVSTGTIKTHSSKTKTDGDTEWEIKTGKEAIIIEDAHPTIKLSTKKKDKRVLGVLGLNTRNNSHPERLIVNSIGEGGIWICNSNGNIENGDYITSSDYLGYGEKQDDDLLHNYTVVKATMDCDFQLDSLLYQCLELPDTNIRIAFIACTYHCG